MILIDENMLSKDTLVRILVAQGIDIGKYVKKVYLEEEIEAIANNLNNDNDDFIEEVKEGMRVAKYIDYDKLFEECLPLYQVKVGTYEGIVVDDIDEFLNRIREGEDTKPSDIKCGL